MLSFIARKILSIFILFVFLVAILLGLQKSREGSAALALSGQRSAGAEVELLKSKTGENINPGRHFIIIMKQIGLFDFGLTNSGQSVAKLVREAFAKTAVLAFSAAIFSLLYGISLGVYGHYQPSLRRFLQNIHYGLMAVPVFVYALALLWIFSIYFMLFPPGGVDSAVWFVLPALTLGIKSGAQVYFFTDEFMERELGKHYVKTAAAFGYRRPRVFFIFILKNMALPLVSFWLLELGSYLAGAAIVEMIYSVPGIGSLLLRALMKYDVNLLAGIFVSVAVIIFFIGIFQEILDRKYASYLGVKNDG